MVEHQLHFKMVMTMRKEPDASPVYFKVDGQRFRNSRTVKLHTGVNYRMDLMFKPPQNLETLNVHGSNMALEERHKDENSSSYSALWSTEGIPLTKKGERDHAAVILKLTDKGTLKTSLQAKFYKVDDIHHCEWGSHFSCIEFECNANEHRNHIDVAKETFR